MARRRRKRSTALRGLLATLGKPTAAQRLWHKTQDRMERARSASARMRIMREYDALKAKGSRRNPRWKKVAGPYGPAWAKFVRDGKLAGMRYKKPRRKARRRVRRNCGPCALAAMLNPGGRKARVVATWHVTPGEGYEVTVLKDGRVVRTYEAGDAAGESSTRGTGQLNVRTLRKFARQTAGDMAQELGLPYRVREEK